MMDVNVIKNDVDQQEQSNTFDDSDDDDHDEDLSIHHKVPLDLHNLDWDDLTDMIYDMDSESMDEKRCEEIRETQQILLSIRHILKKDNIILRQSYKGDSIHMFKATDFQRKVSNYMKKIGVYSFLRQLTGRNPENITQKCLLNIVNRVETMLYELHYSKYINYVQYTTMNIHRARVQLNYLYFVPKTDQKQLSLQPILVCNNGPTMRISDYLSELLWSIFDRITHCQKFSQGADAVQALEVYAQNNILQPTTLFVTFTIEKLCTVFPHEKTLEALEHFLHTHASSDIEFQQQSITIETVIQLVRLVLENQYCIYNNKLYQQMAGGASGSPLTMPLAYIYLYHWKSTLMTTLINNTQEIFGRHLDEAFLTWNGSKTDLSTLFDMSANKHHHPLIHINTSIGDSVHFVDAYLSHTNGILHTKNYHYPNMNQSSLSKILSIPISSDAKSVRKTLIHAVRCCSDVNDFKNENYRINSAYISQGLPTNLLQQYIEQLYIEFGISSMSLSTPDADNYRNLRQRIIVYQQQKIELKRQRTIEQKKTVEFQYLDEWDANELDAIKQTLDNVHKEFCNNFPEMSNIKFKLVQHKASSLSYNDYIIEKRPPLRLLTLSKSDMPEDSDSDSNDSN